MTPSKLPLTIISILLLAWMMASPAIAEEQGTTVKKSNARICYEPGSSLYDQVKVFTSYDSLEACINSGGRLPSGGVMATPTPDPQNPDGNTAKAKTPAPQLPQQL